mmetsp:Transcript_41968/g.108781  ORF Transcript_41968/g.108781 Transcript_41968/m.108781 type:complete len:363 (+) Transcript_41968:511-1599(+)
MDKQQAVLQAAVAACPELSGVLEVLAASLAPGQLATRRAWEETEQAKLQCRQHRTRYLELACLEDALQELIDDFYSSTQDKDASSSAAMETDGLWCTAEVYQSLQTSLAGASAAQRLRIPEFPDTAGSQHSLHREADDCMKMLLGLSAEHVQHPISRNTIRQVIPELERRLSKRLGSLEELTGVSSGSDDETGVAQTPAAILAARVEDLERSKAQEATLLANCAANFSDCMNTLMQLLSKLSELIQGHKHGCVRKDLEAQAQYLQAHCSTLLLKLDTLQHQIKYKTYTSQTVPALCAVAGHLQGRRKELEDKLSMVQCQLAAYRQGGQELKEMGRQYKSYKDSISDAKYALEQMESLALQEI